MTVHITPDKYPGDRSIFPQYEQLQTAYDKKYKAAWFYMHSAPIPCFSPTLLDSISKWFTDLKRILDSPFGPDVNYLVLASKVPTVFNLGGDLTHISQRIQDNDREGVFAYAKACIDVLHDNIMGLDRELTTISLVQGDALGGGFESALSSQVVIAEEGTKLGLPEVLFNLFPGMGAYNLLSLRLPLHQVEEFILSGKLYSAEELYDMGVVDILAEKGKGVSAVRAYIDNIQKRENAQRFLRTIKRNPPLVEYKDLLRIIELWTDACFSLSPRDLRVMQYLVSRQILSKRKDMQHNHR